MPENFRTYEGPGWTANTPEGRILQMTNSDDFQQSATGDRALPSNQAFAAPRNVTNFTQNNLILQVRQRINFVANNSCLFNFLLFSQNSRFQIAAFGQP